KPQLQITFSRFTVKNGGDLKVEIPVVGHPAPKIEWQKNGQAVKETSRLEISNTSSLTVLHIRHGAREHSGEYSITASNTAGSYTGEITMIVLEKPDPPTGPVRIDEVSSDYVTISWEPPEYTGGCELDNYIVEKRETMSADWQTVSATTVRTTIKITKLKTGREYQFRVFAENRYGKSTAITSPIVTAQYPFSVPTAPGTPVASTVTKYSMVIEWEPPAKDGGSPITGYHIERKEKNSILWTKMNKLVIPDARFKTSGLAEGIEYEFRVFAENIAGLSSPSKTSESYVARDPCDPPGKPEAVVITRENITLQWAKPRYDGGSILTGYVVEKKELPDGRWMKANFTNVIENEFTVTGLTGGQTYEFRVTAKNGAGVWSTPSESVMLIAQDVIEGPTAFIDPKFKSATVVQAGETFIIDADYFGKPLPKVTWFKDGKEIDKVTPRMEIKNTLTHTTLTVRNCTRVDGGHFVLSLSNSGGTTSIPVNVKVLDKPGPPDGPLRVKVVSGEKCNLHWNPPVNDGGARVSHYVIEKRETSRVTWTGVEPHVEAVSYKVTKLVPGKEYIFRIAAVNKFGPGEFLESEPFIAQNPFTTPSAPSIPIASASVMVIEWSKPDNDGGSPITGYHIECKDQSSILWTKLNKNPVTESQFKVTSVEEGLIYEFRVCAENMAGVGPCSKASELVAARDQCDPPRNLTVTNITNSSVSLSWDKPEYDGGAKITGYIVEHKEIPNSCWLKCNFTSLLDTFLDVTGLTEGEQYDFRVIAKNAVELLSAPSETTGPVTVQQDVEPPKIFLEDKFRQVVVVKAGDLLRIDANICGRPNPTVFWLKNGRNIGTKGRVEITATKTHTSLLIRESVRKDSGQYTLTLQNTSGTTSRNVAGLSEPSLPCPLTLPVFDGGAAVTGYKVEVRKSAEEDWTVGVHNTEKTEFTVTGLTSGAEYVFTVRSINKIGTSEPSLETDPQVATEREEEPKFDVTAEMRKTLLVKDGSSFTLTVPFTGKPVPNVTWDKADVDLRVRGLINTSSSVTSITVEGATRDDSGKYKVKLQNIAGSASLTLNINYRSPSTTEINVIYFILILVPTLFAYHLPSKYQLKVLHME
uniref:Titin n=1 Tax=Mola mola TaxID=94237 RepID=A0A3Q3XII2_MOLML